MDGKLEFYINESLCHNNHNAIAPNQFFTKNFGEKLILVMGVATDLLGIEPRSLTPQETHVLTPSYVRF